MYFVLVSSYDAGDGGPYELLAECVPRSICNDCERESIACGGTRNGELSGADCVLPVDQSSIDLYDLVLEEETEVTIELASTEFNPFLHLISPACEGIAINDDCTDGSTSSCLSGTFPAGTYIIGANSLNPGEVGDYSLTVRCGGSGRQIGGDCTQDGRLNITDAVCVFQRLFPVIEEVLPCGDGRFLDPANQALLNWNGDGVVDLTDGVSLLNYLFNNGPPHALGIACAPLQGCPDSCGEP
jgi:hypothetical protein